MTSPAEPQAMAAPAGINLIESNRATLLSNIDKMSISLGTTDAQGNPLDLTTLVGGESKNRIAAALDAGLRSQSLAQVQILFNLNVTTRSPQR